MSSNIEFLDLLYDGNQYNMHRVADGGGGINIGGKEYADAFELKGSNSELMIQILMMLLLRSI